MKPYVAAPRVFALLVILAPWPAWSAGPVTGWHQPTHPIELPSARSGMASAWDPIEDRAVIFGGVDAAGAPRDELWSLDPFTQAWHLIKTGATTTKPTDRTGASLVYMENLDQFILYGGRTAAGPSDELWRLDPATFAWTLETPLTTTPPARSEAVAVSIGPTNDSLLIHGGRDDAGALLNDTWEWNGTDFLPHPAGPSSLPAPALASAVGFWNLASNELMIFGGNDGSAASNVQWGFNPATNQWRQLSAPLNWPAPREMASISENSSGEVLLFGGGVGPSAWLGDLWQWDPKREGWLDRTPASGPPSRSGAGLLLGNDGTRAYLFGGLNASGTRDDLWSLIVPFGGASTATLLAAGARRPRARSAAGLAHNRRGHFALFGGNLGSDRASGKTWHFDQALAGWEDSSLRALAPSPRFGHAMVGLPSGDILLFGGQQGTIDGGGLIGDLWKLQASNRRWSLISATTPLGPRTEVAAAWSDALQQLVLYGGEGAAGTLDDSWSFDPLTNQWTPLGAGPSKRQGAKLAQDPVSEALMLVGGEDLVGYPELWAFVPDPAAPAGTGLGQWQARSAPNQPPNYRGQNWIADFIGYDLVLFGGATSTPFSETNAIAQWTGGGFQTEDYIDPPPTRQYAAGAIDPATAELLFFGGLTRTDITLGDTWFLNRPTPFPERLDMDPTVGALNTCSPLTLSFTLSDAQGRIIRDPRRLWGVVDVSLDDPSNSTQLVGTSLSNPSALPAQSLNGDVNGQSTLTLTLLKTLPGAVTLSLAFNQFPAGTAPLTRQLTFVDGGLCNSSGPVDPGSTVSSPVNARACALRGIYAELVIAPTDSAGRALPPGRLVTVSETPPYVVRGKVQEEFGSSGETLYRVEVGSNRCSPTPRVLSLAVDGVELSTHPSIRFDCEPVDPTSFALLHTPLPVPADGSTPVLMDLVARDTCGLPAFGRPASLESLEAKATISLSPATATLDQPGDPLDGSAHFEARSGTAGLYDLRATVEGHSAVLRNAIQFNETDKLPMHLSSPSSEAVTGEEIHLTLSVHNDHAFPITALQLQPLAAGLRLLKVSQGSLDSEGGVTLGTLPAGGDLQVELEALVQPGPGRIQGHIVASYTLAPPGLTGPAGLVAHASSDKVWINRTQRGGWECQSAATAGSRPGNSGPAWPSLLGALGVLFLLRPRRRVHSSEDG